MKGSRNRRREEDQLEDAGEQAEVAGTKTPAEDVLALQQSAGNQAVARMLVARETKAPAGGKGARGKKPPEKKPSGPSIVMKIDGIKGPIELKTFQQGTPAQSGSGGRTGGKPSLDEMTVTADTGAHTAKLMEAMAKGTTYKSVTVTLMQDGKPYMTFKLKKVQITNAQVGGSREEKRSTDTFTLSPESIEAVFEDDSGTVEFSWHSEESES